jgi:predicted CxxxxCH...CXXCH cytochrome family protein
MKRGGSEFLMRTIDGAAMLRDFPVQWVIGAKRMQDAVTVVDDGAWQVLPVYFLVTGRGEWVDYNETKQGPVGPDHPFFWTNFRRTANHECLDCHSTGLKAAYDRAAKKWKTEFVDAGVACESCHGPGARHADSASAADIVHPAKVDRERSLAICAQCHGPRQPVFPILDAGHRFRPGDRYDDFYQALVIVDGRARSGDFFSDGRPRTSSFEFQALSQSRCALIGKATCLSCHSAPHAEHGADELRPAAEGEGSCRGCHAAVIADAAKHTRHQSKEAQSCLACHMPKLVTGVLDSFPDHALDIPVPENTARHAVPNACGSCHKDKAALVLQKDLLRLWPDAAKRQQRRLRLADAIDEKTAAQSQQALTEVIADETEASILRGAAAILLAQRFPQVASTALSPLLRHSDPLLRARALEGLGYAGGGVGGDAVAALSNNSSISVRQMAALVLSAMGDARGEAALQQLATSPETTALPQPHLILGRIALRRGNFNEAAQELEQSVDLVPYAPDALVSLGGAYLRKGRPDLAREQALQALHFSPIHEGAQRLLSMIGTR